MSETQDREVTLGMGRLLGLFLGLVIICAVFFSFGYNMGKNSVTSASIVTDSVPVGVPTSGAAKPSPTKPTPPAVPGSDELTFYKAGDAQDAAQLSQPANSNPTPAAEQKHSSPEVAKPAVGPGYIVQIAAVSKQQDAEALVTALRKKQYPVFIATSPSADSLFHVQVGPFSDPKDAEDMRSRLLGDGYNPILKR